ncbi:MAG TPA: PadR family transcriptional regulator [Gemmataceae bacterium]|nr:PadR family transcriptional regulator [Gemmataceae bacterium]
MAREHISHRNLWALTVLCLLRERPMHPYEMQRLIRQRHKDEFLDLKRGSLYHAIERLRQAGLIEVVETSREGRRPERTTYRLSEHGELEVLDWLRDLLAKPVREPSQFLAALSFLPHLTREDAVEQLRNRSHRLELEILALDAILQKMVPQIGRAVLVEVEYVRAMKQAERQWIHAVCDDIRAGRLAWDRASLGCTGVEPLWEETTQPDPDDDAN